MRLTGGEFKGRSLLYPKGDKTVRPTKEKVRQAIFNVLQTRSIQSFLDLYSGTGAMGLEAISRHVPCVHFADHNTQWVSQNVKQFAVSDVDVRVFKRKLPSGLSQFTTSYDCVFLDPPWTHPLLYELTLKAIFDFDILNPSGLIICEIPQEMALEFGSHLTLKKTSRYGNTKVVYLEYEC